MQKTKFIAVLIVIFTILGAKALAQAAPDWDGDGIPDNEDNCPIHVNPDQADMDGDNWGDACDLEADGDGVLNDVDAFPFDPTEWQDSDDDGVGDNSDNCVFYPNSDQADLDGDGIGDACDNDRDGDGVQNWIDQFPDDPSRWVWLDTDEDGITDSEDNCPRTANVDQLDGDNDGIGDACDPYPDNHFLLGDLTGEAALSQLGSVLVVGDVDGDERDDLMIGAPKATVEFIDEKGKKKRLKQAGAVVVYSPANGKVLYTKVGQQAKAWFGHSVAVTYDLFGTGRNNLVIGAPLHDSKRFIDLKAINYKDAGAVMIYDAPTGNFLAERWGQNKGERYGWALYGLKAPLVSTPNEYGDVTGHLVVSSPNREIFTVKGAGVVALQDLVTGGALKVFYGVSVGAGFGSSIAATHYDQDGDGRTDWVIGAADETVMVNGKPAKKAGALYLFGRGWQNEPIAVVRGTEANARLGAVLDVYQDLDGDSVPEVVAGMPDAAVTGANGKPMKQAGKVKLVNMMTGETVQELTGDAAKQRFGASVATIADLDGNGANELAIGVPLMAAGKVKQVGAVKLYAGDVLNGLNLFDTIVGEGVNDQLGTAVASGDFNRDGVADLAYGIPLLDISITGAKKPKLVKDVGRVIIESGENTKTRFTE